MSADTFCVPKAAASPLINNYEQYLENKIIQMEIKKLHKKFFEKGSRLVQVV